MPKKETGNVLRLVGNPKKSIVRKRAGNARNYGIATDFHGNASAALNVTNTDRTIGGPNYRLRATRDERARHGAVNPKCDAQYAAAIDPMTYSARVTNARATTLS